MLLGPPDDSSSPWPGAITTVQVGPGIVWPTAKLVMAIAVVAGATMYGLGTMHRYDGENPEVFGAGVALLLLAAAALGIACQCAGRLNRAERLTIGARGIVAEVGSPVRQYFWYVAGWWLPALVALCLPGLVFRAPFLPVEPTAPYVLGSAVTACHWFAGLFALAGVLWLVIAGVVAHGWHELRRATGDPRPGPRPAVTMSFPWQELSWAGVRRLGLWGNKYLVVGVPAGSHLQLTAPTSGRYVSRLGAVAVLDLDRTTLSRRQVVRALRRHSPVPLDRWTAQRLAVDAAAEQAMAERAAREGR